MLEMKKLCIKIYKAKLEKFWSQLKSKTKIIDKRLNYTEGFFRVAYNEKGLAFVGELVFRQPITEAQ